MDQQTAGAWNEALADTSLLPSEVMFAPYDDEPEHAVLTAAFYPPGELIPTQLATRMDDALAKELDCRHSEKRIVCWTGLDARLLAPVLRHELEHATQWRDGGGTPTFQLAAVIQQVLDHVGYGRLPSNGQVYNLSPHELDANGAASRFIRSRIGDQAADRLAEDDTLDAGLFRRRPAPEPPDTLRTRLICHAAVWPGATDTVLRQSGKQPQKFLDTLQPGGWELWSRIQSDTAMRHLVKRVLDTVPTERELRAADSPRDGWAPARSAILLACHHAKNLAGLEKRR